MLLGICTNSLLIRVCPSDVRHDREQLSVLRLELTMLRTQVASYAAYEVATNYRASAVSQSDYVRIA